MYSQLSSQVKTYSGNGFLFLLVLFCGKSCLESSAKVNIVCVSTGRSATLRVQRLRMQILCSQGSRPWPQWNNCTWIFGQLGIALAAQMGVHDRIGIETSEFVHCGLTCDWSISPHPSAARRGEVRLTSHRWDHNDWNQRSQCRFYHVHSLVQPGRCLIFQKPTCPCFTDVQGWHHWLWRICILSRYAPIQLVGGRCRHAQCLQCRTILSSFLHKTRDQTASNREFHCLNKLFNLRYELWVHKPTEYLCLSTVSDWSFTHVYLNVMSPRELLLVMNLVR